MTKEQEPFADIGFALGSVYGLRSWHMYYTELGWVLVGRANGVWNPGENGAICRNGTVCSGMEMGCTCGFYAYWGIREHGAISRLSAVYGVVRGYGTVISGTKGFRCELATIMALTTGGRPYLDPDMPRQAAKRYQVPLLPGGIASLLEDYPTTAPPEKTGVRQ